MQAVVEVEEEVALMEVKAVVVEVEVMALVTRTTLEVKTMMEVGAEETEEAVEWVHLRYSNSC